MSRNYYQDLDIKRDASDQDIAKAYRKLSLRWHPKLSNESDEKTQNYFFSRISEAYEVLSDPVKRAFYDKYGEEKLKEGLFSQGEMKGGYRFDNNPERVFNRFYGENNAFSKIFDAKGNEELGSLFGSQFGGQGFQSTQKPQDLIIEVQLTLEEIYNGCSKEVTYQKKKLKNDLRTTQLTECKQTLKISKGTQAGQFVKYEQQGNEEPFQKPSDLIFVFSEIQHDRFQRQGNNLIYVQQINLLQAFQCPQVHVRTLDGRSLHIAIDTILSPQTVKTVKGEGLPKFNNESKKGDLKIKFDIQFPKQLDSEQINKLNQLLQ